MFAQRDPLVVALSQLSKTLEQMDGDVRLRRPRADLLRYAPEAGVMKTERDKCEISGEWSEANSGRDAV